MKHALELSPCAKRRGTCRCHTFSDMETLVLAQCSTLIYLDTVEPCYHVPGGCTGFAVTMFGSAGPLRSLVETSY